MPSFFGDSIRYPKVVYAVLESLFTFMADKMYPELFAADPELAIQRFIPTDLDAGTKFAMRDATRNYDTVNFPFPFTAYQYKISEIRNGINQIAARGDVYSFTLKRKIATYPKTMTVKMLSLFDHPDDFYRAQTYLDRFNTSLTRLFAGIKFKDYESNQWVTVAVPFDVQFEFSEGEYVASFEKYLKDNTLYDIVHTAKINYWNFFASDDLEILEVKEFIVNIYDSYDNLLETFDSGPVNDPIVTANIEDSEIYDINKIDTHIPGISLTFSQCANEISVEESLTFDPTINYSLEWNDESSEVFIKFLETLQPNTVYKLSLLEALTFHTNQPYNYELTFKTDVF